MMNYFLRMCVIALLCMATSSIVSAASLKNEKVFQQGNDVIFQFDIQGSKNENVVVDLTLTIGGKKYSEKNLSISGNTGKTKAGNGKKITWDVLKDFPQGYTGDIEWSLDIRKNIAGLMSMIKGDCFSMGDSQGDPGTDNKLVHKVCISDYYVGKSEVTVGEFRSFVDATKYQTDAEKGSGCFIFSKDTWGIDPDRNWKNPGYAQEDDNPVVCVSWNDATAFLEWKSSKTGTPHRLPTEAEWEYAARSGGKDDKWSGTGDRGALDSYCWFSKNSRNSVHAVGMKEPNGYEVYDMSGNVWEWVNDWYADNYYNYSQSDNPQGPEEGMMKVMRGGSWFEDDEKVTTTFRFRGSTSFASTNIGFRYAKDKK